jgi:hypothetical protein
MDALDSILLQSTRLIRPGGRLVVLSYHSLEDRPVKRFLRAGNKEGAVERDFYGHALSTWKVLTRASMRPQEDEVELNPRARSVSMRVGERTELMEEEVRAGVEAPPTGKGRGGGRKGGGEGRGGGERGGKPLGKKQRERQRSREGEENGE